MHLRNALATGFCLLPMLIVCQSPPPGFIEDFNTKTKGQMNMLGWEFFPNSGFSISNQSSYEGPKHLRSNAGQGQNEFLATPCIEFDTDLDTVSFYHRSVGEVEGFFTLGWQSAFEDVGYSVAWLDTLGMVETWTYYEVTYDPPDTPDVCRLIIGFGATNNGGGKLDIDYFQSYQAILTYNCCDSFITCDSPVLLPVIMLEFTAEEADGVVDLHWVTAQENGVSEYIIERSVDSEAFEAIGSVRAVSAGVHPVDYRFDDQLGTRQRAYYRITIVSQGKRSYSDIVMAERAALSASIYPNPVTGSELTIAPVHGVGDYEIRLYNLIGRLVYSQSHTSDVTNPLMRVDLPTALTGQSFLVQVCSGTECRYEQVHSTR